MAEPACWHGLIVDDLKMAFGLVGAEVGSGSMANDGLAAPSDPRLG
jgi:hypothetical protein